MKDLNSSFSLDATEIFDLTISNQSHNFEKALKHDLIVQRHAMQPPEMSTTLIKQFPLEDQGLVLIFLHRIKDKIQNKDSNFKTTMPEQIKDKC